MLISTKTHGWKKKYRNPKFSASNTDTDSNESQVTFEEKRGTLSESDTISIKQASTTSVMGSGKNISEVATPSAPSTPPLTPPRATVQDHENKNSTVQT